MFSLRRLRTVPLAAVAMTACLPSTAAAQVDEPIRRFAADARGVWARFKEDPAVASALGVSAANLPTRGLGVVLGAHWYPLRRGAVALGLGGELLVARDRRTLEPVSDGDPAGPTVTSRMTSITPQLSLNFGRADGWSYVSGGIGWAGFTAERDDLPLGDPDGRARATNYGGGARWFTKEHLALSVDLRFYAIGEQPAATNRPAFPRMRLMVISVGVGFR
jgi:outer membrane protein with beta-barrel domain